MDIEEFYAADERRRQSAELEFGRDWNDENGRCGVSWVEDTGELYLMREPNAGVWGDAFGDMRARPVSEHALGVEVLGVVPGRSAIEVGDERLGAEDARARRSCVAPRSRAARGGARARHAAPQPSDELPDDKD